MLSVVALALIGSAHGAALELTKSNFADQALSGKGAFVKFLAPW